MTRKHERITHVQRDPAHRLATPQIVQAHGPVAATARQNTSFALVERDRDDMLSRREGRGRVELKRRERGRLGFVPDFDRGRGGGEDGVVSVMGDGADEEA